jgi:hypothetical protein
MSETTSAVSITVHDLQGNPLPGKLVRDLEQSVEKIVKGAGASCAVNIAHS